MRGALRGDSVIDLVFVTSDKAVRKYVWCQVKRQNLQILH